MSPRCIVRALVAPDRVLAEARRHPGDAAVPAAGAADIARALDQGAEVLVISDAAVTEVAAAALRGPGRRLRWIRSLTTGTDRMRRFGLPPGVPVSNTGAAYAPAVATHAVALLLALQRRLPAMLAAQAAARRDRGLAAPASIPLGQRAVALGFGPIGQEICRLPLAFGTRVVAVSRSGAPLAKTR